jgi:UDP-2,3-diacylglucosamine hydrolase
MEVKKVYFISDVHLGLPNHKDSLERERKLVAWLDSILPETKALYLLGDIFDFWYEYKHVVPKGYVRFFAKIAEFTDQGIPVCFFTGNHDVWAYNYFEQEMGMTIYRKPQTIEMSGKTFHMAHGDGLGPADTGFKLLKWLFTNRFAQFMFSRLHPNFALWLGNSWSRKKRYSDNLDKLKFEGADKEWLVAYSKDLLKTEKIDYFLYGHRHIAVNLKIQDAQFINLGDWIHNFTYAIFDGENLKLMKLSGEEIPVLDE